MASKYMPRGYFNEGFSMSLRFFIYRLFHELRHYRFTYSLLLSFILTGCMNTSYIQEPTRTIPDATLSAYSSIIGRDGGLIEKEMPAQWWDLFNDPTLALLEHDAAKSNLDILSAITRIEESRAKLGLINAARYPQIEGRTNYSRQALSEHESLAILGSPTSSGNYWNLGLQAGWELDLWGHLRKQTESAQATLEATRFEMEAVRVSVAADVARTYLLLRGLQMQVKIYQKQHEIAKQLLFMTESQQTNGIATRFDVALSLTELAKIKAQLLQVEHQRDVLINALTFLLGKYPRELDNQLTVADLPPMPKSLPVGIPSELASKRPDILQAEARLRAAVADIGAAEADFYPRVSLTGSLSLQAFAFSDMGTWDSRHYGIGPTLYLPIFQGGRLESNLELSTTRHRLAGLNYQKVVLNAWHEIDNALATYSTELKRYTQLELAFQQRKNALDVAKRGYEEGSQSLKSVLEAERALLYSEFELTECTTSSALSVVSLYRALGGNWSSALHVKIVSYKSE